MSSERSKVGELRDRLALIDAHKATFVVGGLSALLDMMLSLSSVFPYELDPQINDFSFLNLQESEADKTRTEIVLLAAIPIISVVFSLLLMMGNRLRIWITYALFLLFNSTLLFWNILLVIIVFKHVIPQIEEPDITFCKKYTCNRIQQKLYIYSSFLIIACLIQSVFNVIVWRGWRCLKSIVYMEQF